MSDGTTITTDCCPECGADVNWQTSSWCPSCGFYPAINFRCEQQDPAQKEVIYEHWWEVVPAWLTSLLAGVGLIIVVSGCVRVMFADSEVRTWWTVGQMVGGAVTLCTVHFMAYLYSASRSDKIGPLDVFVQPLGIWQPVLRNLPESSNLVSWAAFGITAVVSGYLVVDGVNYSEILKQQAAARQQEQKQQEDHQQRCRNTISVALRTASTIARVQQAACGGMPVPDTLEEALAGLIGDASALGEDSGGAFGELGSFTELVPESIRRDSLPATKPTRSASGNRSQGDGNSTRTITGASRESLPEVECLILGYTTNAGGEIRSLLLAAAPDFKFLRFVAKVPVDQVDPHLLEELLQKFDEIPASKPMVRCPYGGRWVQPELFCIANYEGWTAEGRLSSPYVVRLMNTQAE
jgi:hypothetical protein